MVEELVFADIGKRFSTGEFEGTTKLYAANASIYRFAIVKEKYFIPLEVFADELELIWEVMDVDNEAAFGGEGKFLLEHVDEYDKIIPCASICYPVSTVDAYAEHPDIHNGALLRRVTGVTVLIKGRDFDIECCGNIVPLAIFIILYDGYFFAFYC